MNDFQVAHELLLNFCRERERCLVTMRVINNFESGINVLHTS